MCGAYPNRGTGHVLVLGTTVVLNIKGGREGPTWHGLHRTAAENCELSPASHAYRCAGDNAYRSSHQ